MSRKKLSVAIIGCRGIPNQYGGFEAFAEAFAIGMAKRGHDISVYTDDAHPLKDAMWKGVKRVLIHNHEHKLGTAGQFIYDLLCNLHSRKAAYDIVLHLGHTSDSPWWWLWPKRMTHIVNMDGLEWKRPKYSPIVRKFLLKGEKWATVGSQVLVADSKAIESYLLEKYNKPVRYISYGANIPDSYSMEVLQLLKLDALSYDLIIARMEPDNNIDMAIRAKRQDDPVPLIIVGNNNAYKSQLIARHGSRSNIVFVDAIYNSEHINSLRHYCRIYIHGHSVGGTNPSLLEAMACGCTIAAHYNPFNESVLGADARYFSTDAQLHEIFDGDLDVQAAKWKEKNIEKIRKCHNWDFITDQYEQLFYDSLSK